MRSVKRSLFLRFGFCVVLGLLAAVSTPSQEADDALSALGPFPWNATSQEITARFGPPSFADASFLIYVVSVDGTECDLTLWFSSDSLAYAIYSFPADVAAEALMDQYSNISAILTAAYGEPTTRAGVDDDYATETWILPGLDIEHTVILQSGRIDHSAVFSATQS